MTVATTEFSDCTGGNFNRAPLVAGTVRLIYVTGSGDVPETTAEIQAAKAAGVGLITTDQQPGLPLFRIGQAALADIERGAATVADAVSAVAERQSRGLASHPLYISYSGLAGLKAAIANPAGVGYHVADYAWSLAQSQNLLAANPDWLATQFGDPASNPTTMVPGTDVTLQMAQFDIDCGRTSWVNSFLPGGPAPAPAPAPAPVTAPGAPTWPFGPADYLGEPSSDPRCHSGEYGFIDHHVVMVWQQRMRDRGWAITVDGFFGLQSHNVAVAFQQEKGLKVDGFVGRITWAAAWTYPVT